MCQSVDRTISIAWFAFLNQCSVNRHAVSLNSTWDSHHLVELMIASTAAGRFPIARQSGEEIHRRADQLLATQYITVGIWNVPNQDSHRLVGNRHEIGSTEL